MRRKTLVIAFIAVIITTSARAQVARIFTKAAGKGEARATTEAIARAEARAAGKSEEMLTTRTAVPKLFLKSETREAGEKTAQRPAARPNFDPRQRGIPESWEVTATTKKKNNRGLMYYDPPKRKADYVRDMPGNPKSPFKNAQQPHVRWQRNGRPLDKNGNVLATAYCEEAHIPTKDFHYKPPARQK